MKVESNLNELLEEDLIGKIYNNNLENKEYFKLLNKNNKLSKFIKENLDDNMKEVFLQYLEQNNEKEGIEAEEQFKLGFKTAVKIIIEGLE